MSNTSENEASDSFIIFNQYAFRKTGIIQSSTYIRIENFNLICVPWKMSRNEIFLIASLNPKERELFMKFQNSLCSVYLSCLSDRSGAEYKILIQAVIRRISPIANRELMCFIQLSIKNCPEPLRKIMDDYRDHTGALAKAYRQYEGKKVMLDSRDICRQLGFNEYAEVHVEKREIPVRVLSFSMTVIEFVVSSVHTDISAARDFTLKLYFLQNRFFVHGIVREHEPFGNIYTRYAIGIDYSPELIEILDLFFAVSGRSVFSSPDNAASGPAGLNRPDDPEELESL